MIGTTVTAMSRRWNCGLTAVAIDNFGTNLATSRFVVTDPTWASRRFAIEGANGLGRGIAHVLVLVLVRP
jgi:hypothetical protein